MIRCLYARFAGSVPAFFHLNFLSLGVIATAVLFQLPSLRMIAIPVFFQRDRTNCVPPVPLPARDGKWCVFPVPFPSITPGRGDWKNTAVASTAGMETGKAQHVEGLSRHGRLKWVVPSTNMAISCDDLLS